MGQRHIAQINHDTLTGLTFEMSEPIAAVYVIAGAGASTTVTKLSQGPSRRPDGADTYFTFGNGVEITPLTTPPEE